MGKDCIEMQLKSRMRLVIYRAVFSLALGAIALGLAWHWYGWQLALVLFLALWGNNMSQSGVGDNEQA